MIQSLLFVVLALLCSLFFITGVVYSDDEKEAPKLQVQSTAFNEGELIPVQYTCKGKDISPPLEWSGIPENTKSIALIADDPDAPMGTWVHWVLYDLPPTLTSLPEAIASAKNPAVGGTHGLTDFKRLGYGGPCPPSGTHRYYFKVYALDAKLALEAGATKAKLLKAMTDHILAQGTMMGKFSK